MRKEILSRSYEVHGQYEVARPPRDGNGELRGKREESTNIPDHEWRFLSTMLQCGSYTSKVKERREQCTNAVVILVKSKRREGIIRLVVLKAKVNNI